MLYEKEARKFFTDFQRRTCAFGYGHPDKGFIPGNNTACHMGFKCPPGATEFYSSLFDRSGDKILAKRYWDYILGPNSPWKSALKDIEILLDDKGDYIAFKGSVNTPSLTVFNLCLAARTPTESTQKLKAWATLQDDGGFGIIESLYLSSLISKHMNTYNYTVGGDHGYPFSVYTLSYLKLKNKSPKDDGVLFSSGGNGVNCNHIWNTDKRALGYDIPARLKIKPVYSSMFSGFKNAYEKNDNAIIQGDALFKELRDWKKEWGLR